MVIRLYVSGMSSPERSELGESGVGSFYFCVSGILERGLSGSDILVRLCMFSLYSGHIVASVCFSE